MLQYTSKPLSDSQTKGQKTTDINRDEIFQMKSGVHPFLTTKETKNFGRVQSITS